MSHKLTFNQLKWITKLRTQRSVLHGATLLLFALGTSAWLQRPENPVIPPVPNGLARDRGCRDDVTGVAKIDPQWVSVEREDAPVVAEGVVSTSHVSHE